MSIIRFTVVGGLMGYRQATRRSLWLPRNRRYGEFKARVLGLAMEQGWKGKAVALKERPPKLSVYTRWRRNPRIDWKNVYGALEDSIFSEDRYVIPGKFNGVEWDTGEEEEALVTVEV